MRIWSSRQKSFALFFTSIAAFLVVALVSYATSVGTNISVSGTLTSTGLSTLTGFVSTASSTVDSTLTVSDSLYASSTLVTTGAAQFNSTFDVLGGGLSTFSGGFVSQASSTATGYFNALNLHASSTSAFDGLVTIGSGGFISQASSTVDGALSATGPISASSSLAVANLAQLDGGFEAAASSSVASTLTVKTSVNVATSSSKALGVTGDVAADSTGTTTVMLSSSGTSVGSCVQLQGASSSVSYRIYIGDRGDGTTLIAEEGSCQ